MDIQSDVPWLRENPAPDLVDVVRGGLTDLVPAVDPAVWEDDGGLVGRKQTGGGDGLANGTE